MILHLLSIFLTSAALLLSLYISLLFVDLSRDRITPSHLVSRHNKTITIERILVALILALQFLKQSWVPILAVSCLVLYMLLGRGRLDETRLFESGVIESHVLAARLKTGFILMLFFYFFQELIVGALGAMR